jgi:hypothetical protein
MLSRALTYVLMRQTFAIQVDLFAFIEVAGVLS